MNGCNEQLLIHQARMMQDFVNNQGIAEGTQEYLEDKDVRLGIDSQGNLTANAARKGLGGVLNFVKDKAFILIGALVAVFAIVMKVKAK